MYLGDHDASLGHTYMHLVHGFSVFVQPLLMICKNTYLESNKSSINSAHTSNMDKNG